MRRLVLLVLLGFAPVARAADSPPPPARFVVTINPEGRVSVVAKGELPATMAHGVPVPVDMEIVNQGYITGRLEAQFAGNPPAGATLGLDSARLTGRPRERRTLLITLAATGSADLTIVFKVRNEVPDLGGLDRIHFLVRGV